MSREYSALINALFSSQSGTFAPAIFTAAKSSISSTKRTNLSEQSDRRNFQSAQLAASRWKPSLAKGDLLQKVIYGVKFKDGIEEAATSLDPQTEVAAA